MRETKRVIVTGATGLIGPQLCRQLSAAGYEVVVFSRNPDKARQKVPAAAEYVAWSGEEPGDWVGALEGSYGVIHLAGASIFGKRWDEAYKRELWDSRINTTRRLVEAFASLQQPPAVFLCGSAVGYYGFRDDTPLDESAAPGDDFLARLTAAWEAEGQPAQQMGIRTVFLRTGIVLAADGGALPLLKMPFQLFVGGPVLPGTQWFSWVHIADEIGIILLALADERASGPLNLVAPGAQTNRDFSATLAKVLGTASWLPVPGLSLKLVLGEFADNIINGQRAIPARAQELGYQFQFPTAEAALRDLLKT